MQADTFLVQNEMTVISRRLRAENLSSEKVFDYKEKIRRQDHFHPNSLH